MKRWVVLLAVAAMSALGAGCDKEDMDAASEKLREAGAKVGDAIEETGSKLGDQMEAGKDRIRDAADEIESK